MKPAILWREVHDGFSFGSVHLNWNRSNLKDCRKGGIGSCPNHNYALIVENPSYFLSPLAMPAVFALAERKRSSVSLNCCTDKSLFPRV